MICGSSGGMQVKGLNYMRGIFTCIHLLCGGQVRFRTNKQFSNYYFKPSLSNTFRQRPGDNLYYEIKHFDWMLQVM